MFWPLWPYILHDVSFNPTIPDKGFAGIPMRIWKTIDMGRKEVGMTVGLESRVGTRKREDLAKRCLPYTPKLQMLATNSEPPTFPDTWHQSLP